MEIRTDAPSTTIGRHERLVLILYSPVLLTSFFAFGHGIIWVIKSIIDPGVSAEGVQWLFSPSASMAFITLPIMVMSLYAIVLCTEDSWPEHPILMSMLFLALLPGLIQGTYMFTVTSAYYLFLFMPFSLWYLPLILLLILLFIPLFKLGYYKCYRFIRLVLLKKPA